MSRAHTNDPSGRPKSWNSVPHLGPALRHSRRLRLLRRAELARILHGLEHGGVYLLYGPKTPSDSADRLREIYDRDPRGLVVAPLPALGDSIALGAGRPRTPVVRGRNGPSRQVHRGSTGVRSTRSSTPTAHAARKARRSICSSRAVPNRAPGGHSFSRVAERVRRARLKAGVPSWDVRVRVPPPASSTAEPLKRGRLRGRGRSEGRGGVGPRLGK